ncbi:hypothetical protein AOLI_G00181320 [Acnodon oligacanthus]
MWPTAHTQVPARGDSGRNVEGQLASLLHEEQLQTDQQQQLEKCMVDSSASGSDQFLGQVGDAQVFKVTLHRENSLLGFRVVGGQGDQTCPGGIFVSHVTAGGPADREDGLQVQDRLLKFILRQTEIIPTFHLRTDCTFGVKVFAQEDQDMTAFCFER